MLALVVIRDHERYGGLGKSEIYLRSIDAARIDTARIDAAQIDAVLIDAARIDAAQIDAARIDAARIDAARIDAVRGNTKYNSPGVNEGSSKLFLHKRIV